ncbi:hypothetical protein B0G75_103557 [Paraburkholderia sp. BL18I3N2]|uniref:hypothetical protein n=1 Tax=Paraburkholderia sp. BL18I3N2 TaxID=1938799 RepID=UPI000D070D58|nr:hypothetical protein [Paraburkholderia sp. BL18I3N2]PRX33329.1 hypothetical protein B0G75_103557 [Paraburkholderia sp. BL18I3N2]
MNVTYTDSWYWDIIMYLRAMDIRFYKAPSGGLIASGHWKNSVLHQFPNADGVVQGLMGKMFKQTGEPSAVKTKAASNKSPRGTSRVRVACQPPQPTSGTLMNQSSLGRTVRAFLR